MKYMKKGLLLIVVLSSSGNFVQAKKWWGIDTFFKKSYERTKAGIERSYRKTKKTVEQIGEEVSKAGGFVAKTGVKIGNATITGIKKTGEVTIDIGGKAGSVVLKTGQAVATSSGMVLLNTGGMVLALTQGDIEKFKSCAESADAGWRYGLSTVIDESLKAVGSINDLIKIDSLSLEAASGELVLQGKTPKVSVSGSFFKKDFILKDVQLDLSRPDILVTDLLERLINMKKD